MGMNDAKGRINERYTVLVQGWERVVHDVKELRAEWRWSEARVVSEYSSVEFVFRQREKRRKNCFLVGLYLSAIRNRMINYPPLPVGSLHFLYLSSESEKCDGLSDTLPRPALKMRVR